MIDATLQQQKIISLEGVRKEYTIDAARVEALRGVTVGIPQGAMVAVTGKSGAGKSTLLHIIGTLDRPTSGRVLINGVDISGLTDRELSRFRSRSIGFIFQNHRLPIERKAEA